jgi:polysaccharide deacetylase 2 family uncharacterized protein YibQ
LPLVAVERLEADFVAPAAAPGERPPAVEPPAVPQVEPVPQPSKAPPRPSAALAAPPPREEGAKPDSPSEIETAALVVSPRPAQLGREPRLAIVIDDLGHDPRRAEQAIALPAPLTLSFLPYGRDLAHLTGAASRRGHEVFLHLPMEPLGSENPGPQALLIRLPVPELQRRLDWAFAQVPAAVGLNNHMGSRATGDAAVMRLMLKAVGHRGLVFLDSRTTEQTVGPAIARELGVPHGARDVFLDNVPEPAAIMVQLDEAERLARRRGSAVAIGHPFTATLATLVHWLPAARRRGIRLVGVRQLIAPVAAPCLVAAGAPGC